MRILRGKRAPVLAALFLAAALTGSAWATRPGEHEWRGEHRHEWHDSRYHHDRYYPSRGVFVDVLPPHVVVTAHRGVRFYFSGGVWYRNDGPRYVVVAPPLGLFVPALPPYYTTVYVRGVPYYYANDVYYVANGQGYVVVDPPPANIVVEQPPAPPVQSAAADQLFVYPRQGQSPEQTAADRYACHQWAVSQTGTDPTAGGASLSSQKRADYQRALGACLDGRGYTVR